MVHYYGAGRKIAGTDGRSGGPSAENRIDREG